MPPAPTSPGSPLDRRIVHKSSYADVLVTDVTRCGEEGDRYAVGFEISRTHRLIGVEDRRLPLAVGLELVRQAGLAISHLGEDIPIGWAFLLRSLAVRWEEGEVVTPRFGPLAGHVDVHVVERRRRRGAVSGVRAHTAIVVDGAVVATGHGDLDAVPAANYRAIRRMTGAPELELTEIRSTTTGPLLDAIVGPAGLDASLGIDPADPLHFDHEVDHVPGMLLADAALDAHHALTGERPNGVELECIRFVELTDGTRVRSERTSSSSGTVTTFEQAGVVAAIVRCATGPLVDAATGARIRIEVEDCAPQQLEQT